MRIYTRKGDDGTTGLLYGGRVGKSSPVITAAGAADEAQAALGAVRAEVERGSELDTILVGLERDLYVLMAELATDPSNRSKLTPGKSLVTAGMVSSLEERIDALSALFPPLTDFVVPGHDRVSALLDVARTAVRRAERAAIEASGAAAGAGGGAGAGGDSLVLSYLNRLSDLVWTMARWQEHGESLLSRRAGGGSGAREATADREVTTDRKEALDDR